MPLLPGDKQIVDRIVLQLFSALKKVDADKIPHWVDTSTLAFGPGKLLLGLVVIRTYLERSPKDDIKIAHLLVGTREVDPDTNRLVSKRPYRLLRRITIPEYILAASEGDQLPGNAADPLQIFKITITPKYLSRLKLNVTVKNDIEVKWFGELPSAYVALAEETTEVQYNWDEPDLYQTNILTKHRKLSDASRTGFVTKKAAHQCPRPHIPRRRTMVKPKEHRESNLTRGQANNPKPVAKQL